jgi:hypothetical protein
MSLLDSSATTLVSGTSINLVTWADSFVFLRPAVMECDFLGLTQGTSLVHLVDLASDLRGAILGIYWTHLIQKTLWCKLKDLLGASHLGTYKLRGLFGPSNVGTSSVHLM